VSDPTLPVEGVSKEQFRKRFLLWLVIGVSVVFLAMIRHFLITILLAAIFAGLFHPFYRWVLSKLRGRQAAASVITLLCVLLLIVIPLSGFLGLVASQAIEVSQAARPWIEAQLEQTNRLEDLIGRIPLIDRIPFLENLLPGHDEIAARVGEAAGYAGTFLVNSLASATRGTVNFLLQLFILLYAMFFFLIDGRQILDRILYYVPLSPEDEENLVHRFTSVTRATLKGSLVIGVIQGALGGLAFWLGGVGGPAFWGTVMAVLSVIPGVGAALVWVPAVVWLILTGEMGAAIGVGIWCAVVVGTVDNFLRPRLVGRDAKMSDLMILLSTLGGIFLFGAVGFIVGPIVAAIFVAVWDLYGQAFREILPPVSV
jgi:predicted PurR-regulated permease PerM